MIQKAFEVNETNQRWLLIHALDAAKLFEMASEMATRAAETKLEAVRMANRVLSQSPNGKKTTAKFS